MRRHLCAIASLWAALALSPAAALAVHNLTSENTTFDCGTKDAGEIVTATFTFKNTGDETTPIDALSPSWSLAGIAGPTCSKMSLEPGESATVTAPVRIVASAPGTEKFSRRLTVAYKDKTGRQLFLTVSGMARLPVTIDPEKVEFGKANVADMPSKTITLTATSPAAAFNVTRVTASDLFVAAAQPAGNLSSRVTVAPRRDQFGKSVDAFVEISTDNPGFLTIRLPLSATIEADLQGSGSAAVSRNADGVGQTKDLLISPASKDVAFKITSCEVPDFPALIPAVSSSDGKWTVKFQDIPKTANLAGKALIVKTDWPRMPQVRIPFSDPGGPTAALDWSPPVSGLQIAVQAPNQNLTPTSTTTVQVLVRNLSTRTIVARVASYMDFAYELADAQGLAVERTPAGKTQAGPATTATGGNSINPGITTLTFNPKLLFDLKNDAAYTLKVQLSIPSEDGQGRETLAAKPLTFTFHEPLPANPPGLP